MAPGFVSLWTPYFSDFRPSWGKKLCCTDAFPSTFSAPAQVRQNETQWSIKYMCGHTYFFFKIVSYFYTSVFPCTMVNLLRYEFNGKKWIQIWDSAVIHYMTLNELLSCCCFMYHPSAFYTWVIWRN